VKITVAPDSLKESLSAVEAARAIGRGIKQVLPRAEVLLAPIADGGEGTVEAIVEATGGRYVTASVEDPLRRRVRARFGICGDGRTGVVEMAAASGLSLLKKHERNPLRATTRGTGQLLRKTLDCGVESIVVGIGGSATMDCGMGMAAELGVRFMDSRGRTISDGSGARLKDVAVRDLSALDGRVEETRFTVASDVTNILLGPEGAARVYGPQKGASPAVVERLEEGAANWAEVVRRETGVDVATIPGAGAAGGLGAALAAFLGARIESGVDTVIKTVGLADLISGSDLVFTAEGCMDHQSAYGKAPVGVAAVARRAGVPVVALVGSLGPGYERVYQKGITAVICIMDGPMIQNAALRRADELMAAAAENALRLYIAGRWRSGGA